MKTVKRYVTFLLLSFLLLSSFTAFSAFPEKAWGDTGSTKAETIDIKPSSIIQIEGGKGFTVILKKDGTVWTWGNNLRGKLGSGLNSRDQAAAISGLSGITAIAVGQTHSLALKSDGTVWSWGENTFGQLGDGTAIDRTSPVQVADLTHVTAISAGTFHSVAVKDDGTVWTWGDNTYGQLGDGTNDARNKPVIVKGNMVEIKSIASGAYHTLAIDKDGVVWAWGDDYFGELGYGYDQNRLNTPIMATNTNWHITQIAAGFNFSIALKDDGTLLTWGLINSSPTDIYSAATTSGMPDEHKFPVLINGLDHVSQITAGNSHVVALKDDGSVYAWGDNSFGQLGVGTAYDGQTYSQTFPDHVNGISDIVNIGAGSNFTFAVDKEDHLWAWGSNSYSQLGDKTLNNQVSPIQTEVNEWLNPPLMKPGEGAVLIKEPRVQSLTAGDSDTFVIRNNRLYGWGSNSFGQLGDGTHTSVISPKDLGLEGMVSIDAGDAHTVAVKQDGTLWTWGQNFLGQLGDGTTQSASSPIQVNSLKGVVAAAAGSSHTIALLNNGTVWSFGDNTFGQLGHDKIDTASQVPQLSNILAIVAGGNFNLALENTGKLWAWGDNTSGQLGDGTLSSKQQPVEVSDLTGITAITAGKNFAVALKSDGTVWAWGYNAFGQLGNGSTVSQSKPVQVTGLPYINSIQAGTYHTLAIAYDGKVWAWGQNLFGQLGDGTKTNQNKPEQVKGIVGAELAAAGGSHSMVKGTDGAIWAWGGNYTGQLGDNALLNRYFPAIVTGLSPGFNDIAGHWAQATILQAVEKGYVNGYSDGSFLPDRSITRSEFVKLAAVALHLPISPVNVDGTWYQPYIDALQKKGILQAGDLSQGWDLPITRQEIAALALRTVSPELQKSSKAIALPYAMNEAVKKGILQGLSGGNLAPDEATTRAQAVVVIERVGSVLQGNVLPVDPVAAQQVQQ